MSVIYRTKNYKIDNKPAELVHKVYKDGRTLTYTNDNKGHETEIIRWKESGNLWEEHYVGGKYSETYTFYKNGKLNNYKNEPAFYHSENNYGYYITKYYEYGLLHRTDGPAILIDDEDADVYKREFWIKGQQVSGMCKKG